MPMNKINHCPSLLSAGFDTYSPKASKLLFDGVKVSPMLDFDIDELGSASEVEDAMRRISVSGVQEKFPAIVAGGKIRISAEGERSTHILKPAPWDNTLQNRKMIPANEHLTMQIASQVYGIPTAVNGLCFTPKGRPVYITRRFDIMPDGGKLAMEDFVAIIGRCEQTEGQQFKYNGSYEDIAAALRKNVAAWMIDMERFFELVLFNYIYGNGDAHMKNFSLIYQGNDYRLAPAYDLLNTSLHVNGDDFGLRDGLSSEIEKSDIFYRTGHPCRLDFERFGEKIGLRKVRLQRLLDKYAVLPEMTMVLIGNSFLDAKMQRTYLRVVGERVSRFNRHSGRD